MPDAIAVFQDIARYLVANAAGPTRPGEPARNILRLLCCQLRYPGETLAPTRVNEQFTEIKTDYPEVFALEESINLIPANLDYIAR